MFFKKRKQRQAEEREASRKNVEQDYIDATRAALQIEDPAEKIIALRNVQRNIGTTMKVERSTINDQAKTAGTKAWVGTYLPGLAATTTGCFLSGPVGWAVWGVGVTGMGGAIVVDKLRKKSVAKKLTKESEDHTITMEALQILIQNKMDETVENNVEAISKSSLYNSVLAIPGISDKFSAAAAKHIAKSLEEPVVKADEVPSPVVEEKKEQPAVKHQPSDFSKLKGALNNKKPK